MLEQVAKQLDRLSEKMDERDQLMNEKLDALTEQINELRRWRAQVAGAWAALAVIGTILGIAIGVLTSWAHK